MLRIMQFFIINQANNAIFLMSYMKKITQNIVSASTEDMHSYEGDLTPHFLP